MFCVLFLCLLFLPDVPAFGQGTPAFYMGQARTGEKPQAKVWFHNGFWWCVLPHERTANGALSIHQLYNNQWSVKGDALDALPNAQADVWAEGDDLFVLTFHPNQVRFFHYVFDQTRGMYHLKEGYPVGLSALPVQGVETMVVRQDAGGRFWVLFEGEASNSDRGEIWAMWSDDGQNWSSNGIRLGINVDPDDIGALCHFQIRGKNYLGAIWSQQPKNKSSHRDSAGVGRLLMRVHEVGQDPQIWSPAEEIASGQALADDHLNTAVAQDGQIYLVTKTSLDDLRPRDSTSTLLMLHVRDVEGRWTQYPISPSSERGTRPIVVLDGERGLLHVFYSRPTRGDGSLREIMHRWTDRWQIRFSEPEVAIGHAGVYLNDATSTHQNVSIETGLLVMCWGRLPKKNTPNQAYFRLYNLDGG